VVAVALEKEIARLSKILVEREGITFEEAQARLRAITLEIVVGEDADSPAAHAATLTAISVGRRAFIGGVRVIGALDQPLKVPYPLTSSILRDAAAEIGAETFAGVPSQRLVIGKRVSHGTHSDVHIWWNGWKAGTAYDVEPCDDGRNPLSGIAAGALGVGLAFEATRDGSPPASSVDLWPVEANGPAPAFKDVFLPGALWVIGLGNLGQAFLWALSGLPYEIPGEVSIVLQDRDKVSAENWATSVLVRDVAYGLQKTRVAEDWALRKGFDVRRVDRWLTATDRLHDDDPRLAFSGVDRIEARKAMAHVGFDCILDAGLGRAAHDYDRYRLTIFDESHSIEQHFEGQTDPQQQNDVPDKEAYRSLAREVGACGAAEIAGASVAAAYVSAVAAASAVARAIAVSSGCGIPRNEVRKLSEGKVRMSSHIRVNARGVRHAGKPSQLSPRSKGD